MSTDRNFYDEMADRFEKAGDPPENVKEWREIADAKRAAERREPARAVERDAALATLEVTGRWTRCKCGSTCCRAVWRLDGATAQIMSIDEAIAEEKRRTP